MDTFLLLGAAWLLILMNAFFVSAEFGMVKLRHTQVEMLRKQYGFVGVILASVHTHLDSYLSACQLGITLASLGLGWIGEPALGELLRQGLGWTALDETWIHWISFGIAFFILSFLHIVVGELMPKSLAIRRSKEVSLVTAVPLYLFYWVMYPAIWLLNACSNYLLKKSGVVDFNAADTKYSLEEFKLILAKSDPLEGLSFREADILERAMDLTELKVVEVMRPKRDLVQLEIDQPAESIMRLLEKQRFSRYPIYRQDPNQIMGIVHIKDMLTPLLLGKPLNSLGDLMRPVLKLQEDTPVLECLDRFQKAWPHLALVFDGEQLVGFVTLDHILQVLFGGMKDEFHNTPSDWIELPSGDWLMKGETSLYQLEKLLGYEIDPFEEEDVETVAGLILAQIHEIPKKGRRVDFDGFSLTVHRVRGPRIAEIVVQRHPPKKA